MQQVKAVVARAKDQPVELTTINVADPGPGEALVRVQARGVCHTDLDDRQGGINDDFAFLLGHEAAGVVVAVGPDVTGVAPGDSVILNWRGVCGQSRACKHGVQSTDLSAPVELAPLSAREKEIAAWVAEGLTNRQIAEAAFVSENTVRQHLKRIFVKLDVHSRAQLVHAVWREANRER